MSIKTAIVTGIQKIGFKASKHAPEILVVGGVAVGIVAAVKACKDTIKAHEEIEHYKDTVAMIEEDAADPNQPEYTEAMAKTDKRDLAVSLVMNVGKIYALDVALGGVAVASILGGHSVRNRRYLAAAAGWAASQADYKSLLERIRRDYGEEEEKRLKYDIQNAHEYYDEPQEDGSVISGSREYAYSQNPPSLYSRIFDENCTEWRKDPILNMMFIRNIQDWANDTLKRRGFITLNEVYDALGFEENPLYGNEAGWIKGAGDDYVDFGLFDDLDASPTKRAFINGYERSVLLDFNCVGRIREYA